MTMDYPINMNEFPEHEPFKVFYGDGKLIYGIASVQKKVVMDMLIVNYARKHKFIINLLKWQNGKTSNLRSF